VSELVVNLQDPESVALAKRVLEMVGNDWPNPTTSGVSADLITGAVGGPVSASVEHGSQIDSKGLDDDPWATSAPSPEKPRAARSEPATGNPDAVGVSDDDDDNPWS
jgi:hypothetical protein